MNDLDARVEAPSSPRWFLPVAITAFIWNLLGCAAYLADVTLSPEDIAALSPEQQSLYASRDAWMVAATAIAVWGGALGCLGLILKKRWAVPVLTLSLIGVIVQDLGLFVVTGAGEAAGATAWILQTLVLIISIGLVVLARRAVRERWIG